MRIHFRNYTNALPLSLNHFAYYLLGLAIAVCLGCVNQSHAKLDPKRNAGTSLARELLLSPMRHVPWPSAGMCVPSDSATVPISIQSRLESGKTEETFFSHKSSHRAGLVPCRMCRSKNPFAIANALRGTGVRFL